MALALLSLAILAAVLLAVREAGGPEALRERYGLLAPAISLPLHLLVNVTPLADLVPWAIANGAVYGLAMGAVLNWLAWMGSSSVQFAIGRRVARGLEVEARFDSLPRWLARYPAGHPLLLITGRWMPMAGALVNVGAGAFGVGYGRLFLCAAVGSTPPAIVCAAIGTGLLRLL